MSWNIWSFPQSSFSQEEKTLTQLSQEWQQKPSSASLLPAELRASCTPIDLPSSGLSLKQGDPSVQSQLPKTRQKAPLAISSSMSCHCSHSPGWMAPLLAQPTLVPSSATLQTNWWLLFWQKPCVSHAPDTDNSRHPYSLKSNFTLLLPWIMFAEMHKRNIVPLFMYLSLHRSQYCNRDPYSHLIKLLSNNDYKNLHTRILKCSAYEKAMYLKKLCI